MLVTKVSRYARCLSAGGRRYVRLAFGTHSRLCPLAPSFRVVVNEEDLRGYRAGVVWSVGQFVEVRVRSPGTGLLGPWRVGRLAEWRKCGNRMGDDTPWSSRKVDCFVLLLTRDGSHGLDLSMVSPILTREC